MSGVFKRGGVRATAGLRLDWSRDISSEPDIPFRLWDADLLVEWLDKIGLSMYINDCKRWACNGEQMLKASPHELQKELKLQNNLHKKKLLLALEDKNSEYVCLPASINNLDYQWVLRWLDDVGLPQYKDMFAEARVDGRVLHHLTVEDLLNFKVINQLHHISIKWGIQVLRENNFDQHCLIRRSLPEESKVYSPEVVALWTNHRVMEWLSTIDLTEYASNLRGSGVHGALIIYEPKFNTEFFASVLNIPPSKAVLRHHLTTNFKHIVGAELFQCKRDLETEQSYVPLTPNAHIKAVRRGQFALKEKYDAEYEDYVCPMDIPVGFANKADGERLVVRGNCDPAPQGNKLLNLQTFDEASWKEDWIVRSDDSPIKLWDCEAREFTTILQAFGTHVTLPQFYDSPPNTAEIAMPGQAPAYQFVDFPSQFNVPVSMGGSANSWPEVVRIQPQPAPNEQPSGETADSFLVNLQNISDDVLSQIIKEVGLNNGTGLLASVNQMKQETNVFGKNMKLDEEVQVEINLDIITGNSLFSTEEVMLAKQIDSSCSVIPKTLSSKSSAMVEPGVMTSDKDCCVCCLSFHTISDYNQHMLSKKHQKAKRFRRMHSIESADGYFSCLGKTYCQYCNRHFSGKIPLKQHVISKAHKKQRTRLDAICSSTFTVFTATINYNFCKLCKCSLSGDIAYIEHMSGKKHMKNINMI